MLRNAWLIPLVPAVSFLLILLFGKRLPRKGSEVGIVAVGASLAMAIVALVQWIDRVNGAEGGEQGGHALRALGRGLMATTEHGGGEGVTAVTAHHTWWRSGGFDFGVGIQIDGLAVMMMLVVTVVSFLVHVYSTSYMEGDRRFTHYYAFLSLFTASMLLLVVADNTVQLLVGWELVGLCSFVLIGHWWEEKPNSDAALKAFFTTRTGDVGLLVGVIVTFFAAGTFGITGINEAALSGEVSHTLLLVGAACLLVGIIGKSGQFPLHTWLPDAMAGPTPVSALIHAATMVVAGVYLGGRLYGVFWEGFSIGDGGVNAMALVGGVTVLIGAALAFVQADIKKVLAYSTISQLGYMVMALGVGAWTAAMFHLFTHAFFKALLFLGAGSVSHSGSHHSFDMKKDMGGLREHMPQTFWTFVIGSVALAGIFPFAGFWSKDEILATAGQSGYDLFVVVGLVGALMTAAYMTRCVYLTFFGEYRGHGHPHESPRAITVPLWTLAVLSVGAGFINAEAFGIAKFKDWFEPQVAFPGVTHPEFEVAVALISVGVALLGAGLAYLYYWRRTWPSTLTTRSRAARAGYVFLENKYYLDHLYTGVVVGAIKSPIARAMYWVNQRVIDGAVDGAGAGARRAARVAYDIVDQQGVDGAINGIAVTTGRTGGILRLAQSGRLQRYALVLFAAVGLLSLALVIFT
ncbi:MAG: NADH-quinone oxidoreductase subunit L [Acidimicrobiia bacterium]|nr:NADH-quinone oxidoreductase subunit L [Acidimicrobiia bacterium]